MIVPVAPWDTIIFVLTGGRYGAWPVEVEDTYAEDEYPTVPAVCDRCGKPFGSCIIRQIARACPECGNVTNHWPCEKCGLVYYEGTNEHSTSA